MAQSVVLYRTQPRKGHVHELQESGLLRASAEFSSGCYVAMGLFVQSTEPVDEQRQVSK